jgi:hypothetical protein
MGLPGSTRQAVGALADLLELGAALVKQVDDERPRAVVGTAAEPTFDGSPRFDSFERIHAANECAHLLTGRTDIVVRDQHDLVVRVRALADLQARHRRLQQVLIQPPGRVLADALLKAAAPRRAVV